MCFDAISIKIISVGELSVGEMSVGEMSVGEMIVGEMSSRRNACRRNVLAPRKTHICTEKRIPAQRYILLQSDTRIQTETQTATRHTQKNQKPYINISCIEKDSRLKKFTELKKHSHTERNTITQNQTQPLGTWKILPKRHAESITQPHTDTHSHTDKYTAT